MRWVMLLALGATPALAQDWAMREGDVTFDRAALTAEIRDRTLTFYDDGRSWFSSDGSYSYTYSVANGGETVHGSYTVMDDSIVCIIYPNGFDRCDMYVRAAGKLVVLTENGERYPVRPEPS